MVIQGSSPVFIVPSSFFMVPGRFLWLFMALCWIFMVQCGFLWFFMVLCRFFMVSVGFFMIPGGFHDFRLVFMSFHGSKLVHIRAERQRREVRR